MITQGVRLDRLERGLFEALGSVADEFAHAHGGQPRGAGSLLECRVLGGPSKRQASEVHGGTIRARAMSGTVTITDAVEAERYVVRLDGFRHVVDVPALATVTTVRDLILASMVEREAGRVTAEASGADAIDLTPAGVGALWDLSVLGDIETELVYQESEWCRVAEVNERVTIELQAYSHTASLEGGASTVLNAARARLADRAVLAGLNEYGVSVATQGRVVPLTAIAGGRWESRASLDVELTVRAAYIWPATPYRKGVEDLDFQEAS